MAFSSWLGAMSLLGPDLTHEIGYVTLTGLFEAVDQRAQSATQDGAGIGAALSAEAVQETAKSAFFRACPPACAPGCPDAGAP